MTTNKAIRLNQYFDNQYTPWLAIFIARFSIADSTLVQPKNLSRCLLQVTNICLTSIVQKHLFPKTSKRMFMMADWIQAAETTKASDRACHHRRIKPSQKSHSLTSIMRMLVSTVDGEISGSE